MQLKEAYRKATTLFKERGWKVFKFQRETWKAYAAGESGLVHAPTGTGKTYAVWVPPLLEWMVENKQTKPHKGTPGLRVLWITPLRALVEDTRISLLELCEEMDLPWTVEARTGDTTGANKTRQRKRLPSCLVTTPESLSVLLSYPDFKQSASDLKAIIVDEWHELLSTKRGIQTELCLARLRKWNPKVRTWGLSATLGNLDVAKSALLGSFSEGRLIDGGLQKKFRIESIIPSDMERFPWAGHLGGKLVEQVAERIEKAGTSLVFTNVRSQTEYWFNALLMIRPEWEGEIGIHHGSIERKTRQEIEDRLRLGTIKAVVCTSSLDLGVDFSPVDQVIQIGGPKGIARLLQRAGRCGHQPGALSKVICVPTQAMELVEFAAARDAIKNMTIESRTPLRAPLDLLAQHLVTLALGEGFSSRTGFDEIRSAWSYRDLTKEEWGWVLDFITKGGKSLGAYDQFKKVTSKRGVFGVESRRIERFHRMSIGTITSDPSILVKMRSGKALGTVEESFISRIEPGKNFFFGGKLLVLERVRDLTAYVRKAKSKKGIIPVWGGGKSPLSSELAQSVRVKLREVSDGVVEGREMKAMKNTLALQAKWSSLPGTDRFLIEKTKTRQGTSWFLFPFAGRLAHEGMAALAGYRLSKKEPMTLSVSFNDYGFHLCSNSDRDIGVEEWKSLLSPIGLSDELIACMNLSEMAKRQFREIARVAGLVFQGFPGAPKSGRQLQASGGLFFDVFSKYEPDNLLLVQSKREVLERQLEVERIKEAFERIQNQTLVLNHPDKLTPFSFPLWAESIRAQLSTESWGDRVRKMAVKLEDSV